MQYRFGDYRLDMSTMQLLDGDAEVDIEPQVFSVLAHLVRNRDRLVTKTELLDEVWGSRFVSESALTTRIKQARRAIGDSGSRQQSVKTVHGRGYRFVASVDEHADRPPPAGSAAGVPALRSVGHVPKTRYAEGDGASIAYQTFGEGPELVLIGGYATNVEAQWDHPAIAAFLERLGRLARITVLDKRGVGLSDRLAQDSAPPLETRADDLTAVLDAVGVTRATLLGSSEGGSLAAVYAAARPERVERLILHNTWMTGPTFPHHRPNDLDFVLAHWGTGRVYSYLGPSLGADAEGRELLARLERQAATPRTARHLLELIGRIDISGILGAIAVPTLVLHRVDDPVVPAANGRELAARIRDARLVMLEGADHFLFSGDPTQTLTAVAAFVDGAPPIDDPTDRVLATVLFIDLVNSTGTAQALGDRAWTQRLDRFHAAVRTEVDRFRGDLVNTMGDGVVATFDGPGRAVRAAGALRDAVVAEGFAVRVGLHTAEIQRRGTDIAGIGVHISARVAAAAEPGEIWVSRTVTDLVAGTGLQFAPRGEHTLKGIDEPWMLFAAQV